MKHIFYAFLIVISGSTLYSQTGYIEYDIEVKGITPELNKGAMMLVDSRMRISYQDSNLRQDFKMGNQSINSTILNRSLDRALYFEDGQSGKFAVVGTCAEIETMRPVTLETEIVPTEETKEIVGLTCKKYIVKFVGASTEADYWCAVDYPYDLPTEPLFMAGLPGVPLEFTTTSNGFFLRFKCSMYSETIENAERFFYPAVSNEYKVMDLPTYIDLIRKALESQNTTQKAPSESPKN